MRSLVVILGRVALEQSSHEEAAQLLAESQRLLEKLGDLAGVGETLLLQARIEYRHYHYLEVERLAKQALDILHGTDRYQPTIEVLRILALAAGHQGKYALADEYCQEAIRRCHEKQFQAELPSVYYAWMQVCWRRGAFDLARQHGEMSTALFKLTGDRKSRAYALEYLMRIYLELKDFTFAEERGTQSLGLLLEIPDDWGAVYALRGLAKLFIATNRPDEARQVLTDALHKTQALRHPLESEIRQLMSQNQQ